MIAQDIDRPFSISSWLAKQFEQSHTIPNLDDYAIFLHPDYYPSVTKLATILGDIKIVRSQFMEKEKMIIINIKAIKLSMPKIIYKINGVDKEI